MPINGFRFSSFLAVNYINSFNSGSVFLRLMDFGGFAPTLASFTCLTLALKLLSHPNSLHALDSAFLLLLCLQDQLVIAPKAKFFLA